MGNNMKVPKICKVSESFDEEGAGWYVQNASYIGYVVPDWRLAGGGVCKDALTNDLYESLDKAIAYSNQRIVEIKSHVRKLERAQVEINTGI